MVSVFCQELLVQYVKMCRRYDTFTCTNSNSKKIAKMSVYALSQEYFCTSFCPQRRLRDLLLSSSPYGYWLSNIQLKNAFRSRLLGFVFKLEYSLIYVSTSLKSTDSPEPCRLCTLEMSVFFSPSIPPFISITGTLALLFFTVIFD